MISIFDQNQLLSMIEIVVAVGIFVVALSITIIIDTAPKNIIMFYHKLLHIL
jgi:hypothetical protein